jgi:hypothetical protein
LRNLFEHIVRKLFLKLFGGGGFRI